MFTKVLRKSLILIAVYAVLIIGIFVVQFKNDSIISEKIGSLHITLVESTTEDNTTSLRNRMTAVFNGMSFQVSDEKPARIRRGNSETAVNLVSWEKESETSCVFNFTGGTSLRFSLSDESQNALLNIESILPSNVSSISIPYSLSGGATLTEQSENHLQINSRRNTWEFSAADIDGGRIFMTRRNPVASYAYFDKTRTFSFAQVAGIEFASESVYRTTISNLENNLVKAFEQVLNSDQTNITEQEAVSYVAVRAARGRYSEAIEAIPQSFKRSTSRTYLSAPYFNNLARLNESLVRQQQSFSDMISLSLENGGLDIFTVKNLSDYMNIHPGSNSVRQLLSNTASRDLDGITVLQAAGIVSVYSELSEKVPELAEILYPAVQACLSKIEESCNLDNENITIVENGTFLSVINAVQVGDAVLRYGRLTENSEYISSGRLIINSYLKESESFDSRLLSEIYPIVIHNNTYYPHYVLMGFDSRGAVWAWTCAENMTYQNNGSGEAVISISFPLGYTHYVIINGIEAFRSIYIYDMAFRTDPRFETYNSSGYVHQRDNATLLLKSRHRSANEIIRLVYTEPQTESESGQNESESSGGEENQSADGTGTTASSGTETATN